MADDAEVRKEIRRLENKAKDFSKAAGTREKAAKKAGQGTKIYNTYTNMLKQAYELRQKAKQLKSTLSSKGAGFAGDKDGVHEIFQGPNLIKIEKDYRKGGMVLSTVDNRKNK